MPKYIISSKIPRGLVHVKVMTDLYLSLPGTPPQVQMVSKELKKCYNDGRHMAYKFQQKSFPDVQKC